MTYKVSTLLSLVNAEFSPIMSTIDSMMMLIVRKQYLQEVYRGGYCA